MHRTVLTSDFARQRAVRLVLGAPDGYVATWREIASNPAYAVSDLGEVKRVRAGGQGRLGTGSPLRPTPTHNGYLRVSLCDGSAVRSQSIHRLVCEAFHGPPPSPSHQVAHGDGDKANNRADNLRWATPAENCADKALHGTMATGARNGTQTKPERRPRGERHGNTNLTADTVRAIRADERTHKAIAAELGLSRPTVTAIKNRRNWGHVE